MEDCPTCGKQCKSTKGMKQHHTRSHGKSLNKITVSCDHCETKFTKDKNTVKNVDNSFCSDECENSWRSKKYSGDNHHNYKQKKILECEFCNDSYEEYPYRVDESRFCSQECSGKYKTQEGTTEVSCEWCENQFNKQNHNIERKDHDFCSKECYGKWYSENKTGQNHPNWTGGSNLYEAVRENLSNKSWGTIAELNRENSCYKCGKNGESLHEHHIIPVMYGGVNSEELLMSLCPSCHKTVESYTRKMLETHIKTVA